MIDFKTRDNAGRLAITLSQFAEDRNTVERLAMLLKYDPNQLQEDMKSIAEVVRAVPKGES